MIRILLTNTIFCGDTYCISIEKKVRRENKEKLEKLLNMFSSSSQIGPNTPSKLVPLKVSHMYCYNKSYSSKKGSLQNLIKSDPGGPKNYKSLSFMFLKR